MSSAGLNGPFPLSFSTIEDEIVADCPGTYALGFLDQLDRFCVTYVGSAGGDLRVQLRQHIGTASHFKFKHYINQRSAFEKECELFHRFMPRGNFLHPGRPSGSDWKCPHCDVQRLSP